ncbi:MAG TPA: hypothetical protein PKC43_13185 [Phycisphaerales bacterium]|nr:hypothetical protein [Phycisphaerales bacterium]HMP38386.1 hypothetical protein [Phycisphaerales bacterium]
MAFRSGGVSYARFHVSGTAGALPSAVDDALFDRLAEHVVARDGVGTPPELRAGWCAGRHLLDTSFDWETCGFGSTLLAGVRIDVAKVPPELRRAYVAIAEAERSGGAEVADRRLLGRAERKAAREEADRRCAAELAEGRHRRSTMVPLLWDLERSIVLAPIAGERKRGEVRDLFAGSLELGLHGRSAGSLAWDLLSNHGLASELDEIRPSSFTPPPGQRSADGERLLEPVPEVPWAAASNEAKDFVGNEWLLWMWWIAETQEGLVDTGVGEVALVLERALDLECAWGVSGRTSLRGDAPTLLPEAARALLHGKWPRRAGLLVAPPGGHAFACSLQADRFAVSGATLPEIDDARSEREIVEQRIERTLELDRTLLALFEAFLRARVGRGWTTTREQMTEWIRGRAAARAAA